MEPLYLPEFHNIDHNKKHPVANTHTHIKYRNLLTLYITHAHAGYFNSYNTYNTVEHMCVCVCVNYTILYNYNYSIQELTSK